MKKIGISMDADYLLNYSEKNEYWLEDICALKESGIEHIEFSGFRYGVSGENLNRYERLIKKVNRVFTVSLHFSPFAQLVGKRLKKTWKWRSRFVNFISFSKKVESLWVNMHLGEIGCQYEGDFIKDFLITLVNTLEKESNKQKVIFTVENSFQGVYQKAMEQGTRKEEIVKLLKIAEAWKKESDIFFEVGVVIDVAHLNITGEELDDYSDLVPIIRAFHLSDNYGNEDKGKVRDPHRIIGCGNINWENVFEFINVKCDNVVVIAENQTLFDSIESTKKIKQYLKE